MNPSALFINRPVATTLLTLGVALIGLFAYLKLPVAPLPPQLDLRTFVVSATIPGASPETMATTVAAPLERHLGMIANVGEMTSESLGETTYITLRFGSDRNSDGAARDVQAAINAARSDLPTTLRQNPYFFGVGGPPIACLAMTSDTLTRGQIYDAASTIVRPALLQIPGVAGVNVSGASLPAMRVELNPLALSRYGIGLEDVRAALASANANSPKGAIEDNSRVYQIYTNDQVNSAADYSSMLIAYRDGKPVRLSDVGEVVDSVENIRSQGLSEGKSAVLIFLGRQSGANVIDIVDRVRAVLPQLKASIPRSIDIELTMDWTTTIKASLRHVQRTLFVAVGLVILVVFLFLRSPRATLIPGVAVPVSLAGTFGIMYLLGYSLDNFSLMALTISTGFVIDDASVVLENITRHIETGLTRMHATLLGVREVGFTVVSISLSLIAAFIPVLLMGGIIGGLFREFAMTLSIAIAISLVVSLTTTPMMCAHLLADGQNATHGRLYRAGERVFEAMLSSYEDSLRRALQWPALVILTLLAILCLATYLYVIIPKGFIPQQDNGLIVGSIKADEGVSFQLMEQKLAQFLEILRQDPAIASVTGSCESNSSFIFVVLKPLSERQQSIDQVISRLRPKLDQVAGAQLFLGAEPGIDIGGSREAQYQYALEGDNAAEIADWASKIEIALQNLSQLTDAHVDQQQNGLVTDLTIDRATAARLGVTTSQVDNTLYDGFGQRQVSTIYTTQSQYHVIMELAPEFRQDPEILHKIYVSTSAVAVSGTQSTQPPVGTLLSKVRPQKATTAATTAARIASDPARNAANNALANTGHNTGSTGAGVTTFNETMVPLSAFSHFDTGHAALVVNHQGRFIAATISFNLAPNVSLSEATAAIEDQLRRLRVPGSIHGNFRGTAKAFQQSLQNEPYLIAAAVIAVYIVLGILYESYIHPLTILSTLPSAGCGVVLALLATGTEFSIIALIGVILLIGIVKKNAIIMIDFALDAERRLGLTSREAIYEACLKRFRPIMMTTMAAILGAVPLAIDFGEASELRRPLGTSIVGGLIVSQIMTLYTTPVIYLYLDRFRLWANPPNKPPKSSGECHLQLAQE